MSRRYIFLPPKSWMIGDGNNDPTLLETQQPQKMVSLKRSRDVFHPIFWGLCPQHFMDLKIYVASSPACQMPPVLLGIAGEFFMELIFGMIETNPI